MAYRALSASSSRLERRAISASSSSMVRELVASPELMVSLDAAADRKNLSHSVTEPPREIPHFIIGCTDFCWRTSLAGLGWPLPADGSFWHDGTHREEKTS